MSAPGLARAVRFAEYVFRSDTGDLTGPAGTVRLQPQPAKVLATLLARPGELVTRDDLKRIIWPDTHVEADQGLNFCVRQIRAALSDDADTGRIIETLPRRGYRLVVPVEPDTGAAAAEPNGRQRTQRPSLRAAVAAGLLVVAVGFLLLWDAIGGGARARPEQLKVGLLPFVAPANEPWMLELNEAAAELLVTRLATMDSRRFGVIGPVTTRRFAGDVRRPQTEIAAQLGVSVIVSGGIRPSDSTLFVQAIRASDGVHAFVWREKVWNRSSSDVVNSILDGLAPKLREESSTAAR